MKQGKWRILDAFCGLRGAAKGLEAIPPAYSRLIGEQLLRALDARRLDRVSECVRV